MSVTILTDVSIITCADEAVTLDRAIKDGAEACGGECEPFAHPNASDVNSLSSDSTKSNAAPDHLKTRSASGSLTGA